MIDFFDINFYIVLFLGLMLGSFMNVILYRLPRGLNFTTERSMCPNCNNIIKWYDLIPVVSYMLLGGKCRHCKEKISIQYPFVEIITALMFGGVYSVANGYGVSKLLIAFLLFITLLIVVGCFTDFLYLGCYDFSTYIVCILYVIFILFATGSFKTTLTIVIAGLTYLVPMILMAVYAYASSFGKVLYKLFAFMLMLIVAVGCSVFVSFNVEGVFYLLNAVINWIMIAIPLILADYLINKLNKNRNINKIITGFINWVKFVSYFMFISTINTEIFSLNVYKTVFTVNLKNILILIISTIAYLFFVELFEGYDNDVELIAADEEIQEKEENKFSNYIGDGDFLIMPLAGMILGSQNVLSFFCILAINILAIYGVSFKKGMKYHIPLYPFIMLSVVILYFINTVT